ncbi:RibD family protein [Myxococcus sp. AM011]|uniref:RibD family protein n=1 Tax=Myxococcus sp. AM011 TaxID=2745200 RepID=UPI0015962B25|nr:RibD family protein [Myxococcus sp. AM011]NVJ24261.1 RibD family protein [Myxococcus sp. AM011]
MSEAKRPYVICHMVPSLDGRIVTRHWKLSSRMLAEYERTAETFDAEAWMIGRISMEPYAGKARVPARKRAQPIPRKDFIARRDAESYAIALDPSGKLTWKSASIDEEHVITVLTEQVSDDYLAFLQAKGISYLFGGKAKLNLRRVLEKLRARFGIKKLLLEGGGRINGSFLAADLIDELSVLVAPIADGSIGTPSLFDASEKKGPIRHLELVSLEKRAGDLVWLRYKPKR